ncbi:MAG: TIGR00268 family protein [Methanocorpusculum sp.]|nr:TIGR00268 family protein [Methanocorpusculum sp.]
MNESPSMIPAKLTLVLQKHAPLLIALSGGQDSLVLLAAAHALDLPVAAATVVSEFVVPGEAERAAEICRKFGVSWHPIEIRLLDDEVIRSNPVDRCYLCKQQLMRPLLALANDLESTVCDGTHTDDLPEERPGYAVLRELGICSPFAEAGIGKAGILSLADSLGIPRIPASSCLATRIPFGVTITRERLKLIAAAETLLRDQGISGTLRVRLIADGAVVEVEAWEMQKALALLGQLEDLGLSHVRIAGYAAGGVERWRQTQQ